MKKIILLSGMLFLAVFHVHAQSTTNPYFNYKGKLIII